jgi:acyl-[acyl-carrier-protein]-phospholipid O-acyltransferase/long-chain-fatty-acid--[acyl-carrier-protein] ligase
MTETPENSTSSFTYLNTTQFLAALNDNIYKLLVIYFLIQLEGIENSHRILSTAGAVFVLPFLLFSASAGTLADRFSKRNIIVFTKVLEFLALSLGVLAFYFDSKFGAYAVLFLMATLSAIFGPSKYSILPELVATDRITRANGLMTSFTFLAIILGTFIASFMLDITGRNFIFAGLLATLFAFVAMAASFCIEYTPPSGSSKRFDILFLREIASTLKQVASYPSLLTAIFGSAFFLFLGAFAQLNMIPYAVQALHLTDVQGGYLFLLMALGIGSGSLMAGKISGKTVELGLVPLAGLGIIICCYSMDAFGNHLFAIIPITVLLGFFGGMYQIPLDSYIQVSSPHTSRGQIVAATNFLSFVGVLCASLLLYLNTEIFGIKADRGFSVIGSLTLAVTLIIGFQYFDYLTRFVGMILSRIHFKTSYLGKEDLPDHPTIYICKHTAWNDTLLLLGAQRRRIRFFIEQEQDHRHPWIVKLYRLLRVIFIPPIEPLENNPICLTVIKNSLKKGISVCIFVDNQNLDGEIERLNTSFSFQDLKDEFGCEIIPVRIEKGQKHSKSQIFTRMMNKVRVPAIVKFRTFCV